MISYQAYTEEIDDIEVAVSELKTQLADKKLLKNTVGILFVDYDTDCHKLAKMLKDAFPFPCFGVTNIATLCTDGYHDSVISMTVLTADDCEFSIEYTDELKTIDDNKLKEAYIRATERLEEKEKVIITFLPWSFTVTYDDVVDILDVESGGVPVFGGVGADGWVFTKANIFSDGECRKMCGVLLLVSGNINPVLLRTRSVVPVKNTQRNVVSADGSKVYDVTDASVIQYLSDNLLVDGIERSLGSYLATPFIVSRNTVDGDRIELLRTLNSVDFENGYGDFVGGVKNGDAIELAFINKNQMEKSLTDRFDELIDIMNTQGGFSVVLCSSCGARYAMLVGDKQAEARAYEGRLPKGINLNGGYMFGEFCPVKSVEKRKLYNAFNNETFAILAF